MSRLQPDGSAIDFQQDGQCLGSSFSVWHVHSSQIADCLQTLKEPSVLLTSEDGTRRYLSIFQGSEQRVRLCHEFGFPGTSEENMGESEPELGHYFLSYDELAMPGRLKKHALGIDKSDFINRRRRSYTKPL